jgi:hypothetical protein
VRAPNGSESLFDAGDRMAVLIDSSKPFNYVQTQIFVFVAG